MKLFSNVYRALRTLLSLLMVVFVSIYALAQSEHCVSVPATAPVVDGILSGAGIAPGGGGTGHGACAADPGWAGVVADNIPVVTVADTQGVNLFIAGHSGGANLDKLFVGAHVQITPDLGVNDHVTLYFHFGGGGAFASPDFALTYTIGATLGAPDATPSDSECNLDAASISYYTFSAGNWAAQNVFSNGAWSTPGAAPDGSIISKKSWDFDKLDDTEAGIWELELSVDLVKLGITVPSSGTGLSVGAKVYLHDKHLIADTVYYYPQTLTDFNTDAPAANQGNITNPNKLQALTIGSACSNDVEVTQISSTDAKGNPNDFTIPNFDNSGNTTTPNNFTAKVKFYNPNNPGDSSPVGVADAGQVQFHIMPWNGGFTGDYTMATPSASFDHLNQEIAITNFVWPTNTTDWNNAQGNPQPPSVSIPGANHACLKVQINGFNVNVVDANDVMQENLTYTHASTIRDSFVISNKDTKQHAPTGKPLTDEEGYVNYVLRVNFRNIGDKHGWKYEFEDPDDIGLKKITKGYYRLRLRPGEEKRVRVEIRGGSMPGSLTKKYFINATAGGTLLAPGNGTPPLEVPVKPASAVSILARGLIRINPDKETPANDPNGFGPPQVNPEIATKAASVPRAAVGPHFLMKDGYYRAIEHQGALIGSFDNFQTAFVVGTDSTFLVPDNVTKLSLAINDQAGQYSDNTGQFEVNVNVGQPVVLPTSLGQVADLKDGIPVQLAAGNNLPRLDIDVMQLDKSHKLLLPTGYVSWAIYASKRPWWSFFWPWI